MPLGTVLCAALLRRLHACFSRQASGQSLVEYTLLLMLVALVSVGAMTLFGNAIVTGLLNLAAALP